MDTTKITLGSKEKLDSLLWYQDYFLSHSYIYKTYAYKEDTILQIAELNEPVIRNAVEHMLLDASTSKSKYYKSPEDSCSSGLYFILSFRVGPNFFDTSQIDTTLTLYVESNYFLGEEVFFRQEYDISHLGFALYTKAGIIGIVFYNTEAEDIMKRFLEIKDQYVRVHIYKKFIGKAPQIDKDLQDGKVDDFYYYPKSFLIKGGGIIEEY